MSNDLADYIRALVDDAPPLSQQQRDTIALAFGH